MWHAYDYGWRRVMLGDRSVPAGYDRTGEWFNQAMVEQAEGMWRIKRGRPRRPPIPQPSGPDAVRTDWRRIPASLLTSAEHAIADPIIAELAAKARHSVVAVERKAAAFFDARSPAREIPPPRPKPAYVDVPAEEVLASLERLSGRISK